MSLRILALDTATEACSAALVIDGELIAKQFEIAPRRHATLILPQLEAVLSDAGLSLGQLDALAYGRGPGAFTGVRLAASVVQGIAFAANLPVLPISDLAALAYGAQRAYAVKHFACAIDARMGEVYWACYCADALQGVRLLDTEIVSTPDAVAVPILAATMASPEHTVWQGVGSAWSTYPSVLQVQTGIKQICSDAYPTAASVALLGTFAWQNGEAVVAQDAIPVYLRDRVAHRPKAVMKSL